MGWASCWSGKTQRRVRSEEEFDFPAQIQKTRAMWALFSLSAGEEYTTKGADCPQSELHASGVIQLETETLLAFLNQRLAALSARQRAQNTSL